MELFFTTIAFIIGTAFGSFLSVVVYRLHSGEKGIVRGRSQCPACKTKLKWFHLIPIFSWLYLRGRCNDCGKKISSHYFVMELVTGLLFAFSYLQWGQDLQLLAFYLIEICFMLAIFFYDLMYKEIPDRLSLPAIVIAIVGVLALQILNWQEVLAGGLLVGGFFLAQFVLSKGRWIGGGDIRLGALIGVLLGWKMGLAALAIAYITGGLISIFLLLKVKITKNSEIAFGPFLVTGALVVLFFGEEIINWYLNLTLLY